MTDSSKHTRKKCLTKAMDNTGAFWDNMLSCSLTLTVPHQKVRLFKKNVFISSHWRPNFFICITIEHNFLICIKK